MSDARLTPANGRVAAMHLAGSVTADRFVSGWPMMLARPVTDLSTAPDRPRTRQLLRGAIVTVFEDQDSWSFVQAPDGYVGYVMSDRLVPPDMPSHAVATPATHAFVSEDFKSPVAMALPHGARVAVRDERRKFFETDVGFVPKKHLRPLDLPLDDPATVAQLYFGVPYLWGGNSIRGIDCSGLVSAALGACGQPCPGDSDLQQSLGGPATGPVQRGDLFFWAGHVAMAVDAQTLIHANAHHMAVAYEPISNAVQRIEAQGGGPVTAQRRL